MYNPQQSDIDSDGTILINVSKIQKPLVRRLAIAGTFLPIIAISFILITGSFLATLGRNLVGIFETAKKYW